MLQHICMTVWGRSLHLVIVSLIVTLIGIDSPPVEAQTIVDLRSATTAYKFTETPANQNSEEPQPDPEWTITFGNILWTIVFFLAAFFILR